MYVIIFVFYINYSFYVAFALLTSRTFLLNISFQFALNFFSQYMRDNKN